MGKDVSWEKTCPDSSQTSTPSFTPLSFSVAEKSVMVQKHKQLETVSIAESLQNRQQAQNP